MVACFRRRFLRLRSTAAALTMRARRVGGAWGDGEFAFVWQRARSGAANRSRRL